MFILQRAEQEVQTQFWTPRRNGVGASYRLILELGGIAHEQVSGCSTVPITFLWSVTEWLACSSIKP